MTAREELNDLLKRTNASTGKTVTADELLRLWRQNTGLVPKGSAAEDLLQRFDREEREREILSEFSFTVDDLVRAYTAMEQQRSHIGDAFSYIEGMDFAGRPSRFSYDRNPFGRRHAQQFREPPNPRPSVDPAKLRRARKVKALADDRRGDHNTRQNAERKLAVLCKELGMERHQI